MEYSLPIQGQTQIGSAIIAKDTAHSEQVQYQLDVFQSILKVVAVICGTLAIAYFVPFYQQGAWSALVISLTMLSISVYSIAAIVLVSLNTMRIYIRIWLAIATWTVFSFGLLQTSQYINVMALGAAVVIVLAIFLEPVKNSYQWAFGNIAGYILVVLLGDSIHIPQFDLGMLHPLVMYATPIGVLVIITEVGRITTQHFKINLIQSEAQRNQLQIQETKLIAYAIEADDARLKAERSDRVKTAFLASMSHELRTPLNAIINFTRFVVEGDTGPVNKEQTELLTDVVNSARHLLSLINDVLDMSKIEADSLSLFVEDDINLNNIIDNVLSTGRSLLANKSVSLQSDVSENLPLIRCDQQRVFQILLNLMSNACKFTEIGTITIRAIRSGDELTLSVADTGPGIAEEDQYLVFEAFKQTRTGLRHGSGTGLGLTISKNLAQAHGGRLWLESELGKGATFYLTLPICSAALAPVLM